MHNNKDLSSPPQHMNTWVRPKFKTFIFLKPVDEVAIVIMSDNDLHSTTNSTKIR